ncbi:MAG: ABC transporter ATP-binding protein, partial [Lachnospiraceae bacterium]|nr:ABC transporter ATP-binding protein [Lachnospiraceae bacterium]
MLKAENLYYAYPKSRTDVIEDLSFEVDAGEAMVFVGPNGTGKSTVLSMLAGVIKPKSGKLHMPKRFGYVPQGLGLFEDMTVEDNLKFFYKMVNTPVPQRLPLGLEPHRHKKVVQLSGGLAKRVSIACALAGNPDFIIFDEPCTGLDIISRDRLQR